MTHEPNTTNPFINGLWDEGHIWVDTVNPFKKRVVFVFNLRTYLTRFTRLAYKIISYFDIIAQLMVIYIYIYMFITIFIVVIVF